MKSNWLSWRLKESSEVLSKRAKMAIKAYSQTKTASSRLREEAVWMLQRSDGVLNAGG